MNRYLDIAPEVKEALDAGKPVVALESTIISHGMPYPQNVETALKVESIIREAGAVPATIAIIGGRLKAGLTREEIDYLGKTGAGIPKASRRDLPVLVAQGRDGACTVTTTMMIADMAGIRVFATGGIGGVHRGAQETFDISADLEELADTSVMVICAGAKSILDLGLTLEYLETHGVTVIGYGTDELPAFYTRKSGFGELVDPYVAMWHSDQQLADYLLADLDAADGSPLFSFAVSYQNHGPYAETESAVPYVSPEASGWSRESCNILNNYLFGVNETVREYVRLAQELDARDTPVVLVLFGDHKPWMGNGGSVYEEMGIDFDTSTLAGFRNYYATPYLIWANRAAKEVLGADFTGDGGDFSPCFLMTRLFDACGWAGPGYMQLSRAMRDISPLLHTNGLFLHDGVLTSVLSDTDRSFYRSWLAVQYYREHVAAYS